MPVPEVSIVTLLLSRHCFLERAVRSAIRQAGVSWELILLQDGDDASVAAAAQSVAKLDPRIRYLRRSGVASIGDATNCAVSYSNGEFIAILDDDDEWCDESKLLRQVMLMRASRRVVACGGAVVAVDEYGNELLRYAKPCSDAELRRSALSGNPIAHSSAVYRRSAFDAVGGYETRGILDFQDWEFWLRMGRIGELRNVPDYVLRYTVWHNSSSAKRHRSNAVSAWRIVQRHRDVYPGYVRALFVVACYWGYSLLPGWTRRRVMPLLSKLKKRLYSSADAVA